jgi:hypothetical protein
MRILSLAIVLFLLAFPIRAEPPSMQGKIFVGYQGWFAPTIEGSNTKWFHYGSGGKFEPGKCVIEMWPDTSELTDDEKVATGFKHADGAPAFVFSSSNAKTVDRHFKWMKDYDIDGAFLQRFAVSVASRNVSIHINKVLDNVMAAAKNHGRSWAVMYDLSGMRNGQIARVVVDDWKRLVTERKVRESAGYIKHNGKPVVCVWGMGFNDNRNYTLDECLELVKFLKSDPTCGGNTVIVGVPYYWRTLDHDTVNDPKVHEICKAADIVSPWAVGRIDRPETALRFEKNVVTPDVEWCKENKRDYLPVIFPGFSWHNLMADRGRNAKTNQIPRLKGKLFWTQAAAVKRAGAQMIYVAMFDEVDEGTAIFKVTDNPPVGASPFVGMEGLKSDHYLWLAGKARAMLRGEIAVTNEPPARH